MKRIAVALLAIAALAILLIPRSREAARHEATPAPAPVPAAPGFVRGTVMGKYGTLLGVPVLVLVDGKVLAESRTDFDGRYGVEVPAAIGFDLEARPGSWTELRPVRRRLSVAPGAEVVEDFVLGGSAGASGHIEGAPGDEPLTVLAIRAEDYPASESLEDLRKAAKLVAEARGTFTFTGLDLKATYRVAVDSDEWRLEEPVSLVAGDSGIAVRVERMLRFAVEARDIEGGAALPRFTVNVIDRRGRVHDRIEARDGRAFHRAPHPEQFPLPPHPVDAEEVQRLVDAFLDRIDASALPEEMRSSWKLVVEAEGYLSATASPEGEQRVFLQRLREPRVFLLVVGEDRKPIDGELEGRFEAAEQPDGFADAHVERQGPGRFRAVLPPGAWRLRLSRGDATVHVHVDVPERGTVTVEPPALPRGKP